MTQQAQAPVSASRGKWVRLSVLGLGVLVCGLLFFADKSNLKNQVEAGLQGSPVAQAAAVSFDALPPLAQDGESLRWQEALADASPDQQLLILDSLIQHLEARGRYDYGALYAEEALRLDSAVNLQARAGLLAQKAADLAHVQADSSLRRYFNQRSITLLESANEQQPDREDVLLALGLAYVNSGLPENSMKGILTIRRVTELNPENIEASYQLGRFSVQTGQLDKAEQRFRSVLDLDPNRLDAKLQLAQVLIELNRPKEAQPLLESVVQDSDNNQLRLSAAELLENIR